MHFPRTTDGVCFQKLSIEIFKNVKGQFCRGDAAKFRLDMTVDIVLISLLLCFSQKNEREYYYEVNEKPVALLHTAKPVSLGAPETNGHIWAEVQSNAPLKFMKLII